MNKNKPIKFRWILLSASAVWVLFVTVYAFRPVHLPELTFWVTFTPVAMVLVPLAPLSVTRVVIHRWLLPIIATWSSSAIIATHFTGTWLTGFGHQCDRVVLIAALSAFCLLNICWSASRLWRRVAAFVRRRLDRSIQAAVV